MSHSSHGPSTSEQATVLTEQTAVAQGVGGGLYHLLKENRLDRGPEIPLCPAAGRHVPIHSHSPDLSLWKKMFLSPEDNPLCSHPLKACDCEWHG